MVRPPRWIGDLRILVLAGITLVSIGRGNSRSSDTAAPDRPRQVARPLSIAVREGKAAFDLPTPVSGSKTLVIVSALARPRGPYPIRLSAGPTETPRPIEPTHAPVETRRRLEPPPLLALPPVSTSVPLDRRTFFLMAHGGDVASASSYLAVVGQLRATGQRIQVYEDVNDAGQVDELTLRDLVSTFDQAIFPEAARRFGPANDTDRDGRFTVLFSSQLDRMAGGKFSVEGFVRGTDLDGDIAPPFGNRCDMMFLSTRLKAGPHLRTIVAHEYTHAVTFSRKALVRGGSGLEEEGWLDEALAHLVEDEHGFSFSNLDYRVSAFLSKPEAYRLAVEDYYAAELFRSHGNRGATFLFLRWCVDRYGPGLLDALVRSDRRGVANLEAATGVSFAELFRGWTVSLYRSGLDPSSSTEEGYRAIDPRGDLEGWILAGPRSSTVGPSRSRDAWLAQGTTTHYVVVEGFPGARGVAIDVEGPKEAEIQVTVVPLPDSLGRPELKVHRRAGLEGEVWIEAEVTERDGTAVRLGALAWEPLVPADDPRKPTCRRGGLDMLGISRAFGSSFLPANGRLRSASIDLAGFRGSEGPMVFKVVGTDAQGRRVAAWTIVDLADHSKQTAIQEPGPF